MAVGVAAAEGDTNGVVVIVAVVVGAIVAVGVAVAVAVGVAVFTPPEYIALISIVPLGPFPPVFEGVGDGVGIVITTLDPEFTSG